MKFPKFLRIVSIPKIENVTIKGTLSLKKIVYDDVDDIMAKVLAQMLGFSYRIVTPDDGEYGTLRPNGNWTGMIGMIQNQKADLILHRLSMTEERTAIVDFSYPYTIDRFVFASKKLEQTISRTSFLKPFLLEVWIALLISAFAAQMLYFLLYTGGKYLPYMKTQNIFLWEPAKFPVEYGQFTIRVSWMLLDVLSRWSYTAVLLSFLTFPSLSGVRTIQELATAVMKGKYQCITVPGAYLADAMLKSNDSYLFIIGKNLNENNGTRDILGVLSNTERSAYITTAGRLRLLKNIFFVSDDGFFPDMHAVGLKKDFCCSDRLNTILNRIWCSGIYKKMLEDAAYKEMRKKGLHLLVDDNKSERQLSVKNFEGLFILLIIGYSFALIVFLLEMLLGKIYVSPMVKY